MVNMFNMGKFQNVRLAHNTYIPTHVNIRQPQQRLGLFGFGCGHNVYHNSHHAPQNIVINQGPQGVWGFLLGLTHSIFGGGPYMGGFLGNMYGMGIPGMYGGSLFNNTNYLNLSNSLGTAGSIQQGTPQANQLNNLNELFKDYKIVPEANGTFTTISKDGSTILSGSYEDMKTKLSEDQIKYPKTEEKEEKEEKETTTTDTGKKETVDNSKKDTGNNNKAKVENTNNKVADNNQETIINNNNTVNNDRNQETVNNNRSVSTQTKKAENTEGKKPISVPGTQNKDLAGKPVTIEFYSDVKYENPLAKDGSKGGYATATVNGKKYTVSVGPQDSHTKVMQKLGEKMMQELKADGYTNIKFTNNNFKFQMSEQGEVKNIQQNDNIDWSNPQNKKKEMRLKIEFSIKVNAGNIGTATVKLPNGEKVSAWVGPSLTSQRARTSLAGSIQTQLKGLGWTNVTLVNDNFNLSYGPN